MAEILSPAGNMESLVAAVRSGADAVYIGSTEFSARRNAENFDKEELKSAVEYCHIRGVKLYLTLNIMIKNNEISDALALAGFADEIGIDGLIIEDLGLCSLIFTRFPQLPLHGSTQMTIHEASALPYLKKMGLRRVVIAREMSKWEIAKFCKSAKEYDIEVEVFVHGALCMCVSGQCLLSSVLGSRSGNRGLCAGPCRLPFAAEGGTGYDLSLKDLSLLNEIKELEKLGVKSFKIEGRMKRPEYVAAATAAARQMVDIGKTQQDLSNALNEVFSRSGFTKGYYEGKLGREMFGIRTKEDVLSSAQSQKNLHELYRTERQSVAINISAEIFKNTPVKITVSDGKNTVCVKGDVPEIAQMKETEKKDVIILLSKFGGTPYYAEKVDVLIDGGLFLPASFINALRRKATEKLNIARSLPEKHNTVEEKAVYQNTAHALKGLYARFRKPEQIPQKTHDLSGIILPVECDFSSVPDSVIKIADMPRYIISKEQLLKYIKRAKEQGVKHALCGNLSTVIIAKEQGLEIIGDIGLNIANNETAKVFEDMGVSSILTSCELTLSETEKIETTLKKGIFAYGRLPLMLTRNCPLKNGIKCENCQKKGALRDRKGLLFPVRCRMGYSEVFNSAPIYLADRLSELKGIDFILLNFTDEDVFQAERIIKEYKNGSIPNGTFTRGLYYKGVQ